MANFPTSLPSITNPTANDTLAAVPHHTQHGTANDEIAAIAAKVGTSSSTPTTGTVLAATATGVSGWGYPILGSGDVANLYATTVATRLAVKRGTSASPDTSAHPVVKIEQHQSTDGTGIVGDGSEQLAALLVITKGRSGTVNQPVAVHGVATVETGGDADATGGYFRGVQNAANAARGIGLFAQGFANGAGSYCDGAQIVSTNDSGTDHSINPTGISHSVGIWVCPSGAYRNGAGVQVGNGFGTQYDVGFHVNGQVTGDYTGGARTAAFRDDSSATYGVQIRGTHTAALVTQEATGYGLWVGNGQTKGIIATNNAGSGTVSVLYVSTSDHLVIGGATAPYVELASDLFVNAQDIVTDTTTGMKIGTATNQKLGFYNATPVVKPTGVAVSAAGIHAALVTLGLIAA